MGLMDDVANGHARASDQWKIIGDTEKKMAVNSEMKRMMDLPGNSSYASHRIRVLNKILNLMSNQVRSPSENEELELLFAGLSL